MTKVEELKKMYENMGGDPEAVADKTLITEMLDAMSELELSELPDVTADDNGDVLTVVEGAWAKAVAPTALPDVTADDNGDVLTVVEGAWAKATPATDTFVFTGVQGNSWAYVEWDSFNNADIFNALSDRKTMGIAIIRNSATNPSEMRSFTMVGGSTSIQFGRVTSDASSVTYERFTISNQPTSNRVYISTKTINDPATT